MNEQHEARQPKEEEKLMWVTFPNQHEEIPGLVEEDDLDEQLIVAQIGPRRWRILQSPVFSEAVTWGNIVEGDIDEDGHLSIERLAEAHEFRTIRTGVPHMFYFSDAGKAFFDRVLDLGGMWEVIFWGILILNLPEREAEDLEGLFQNALRESSELGRTENRLPRHLLEMQPEGGRVPDSNRPEVKHQRNVVAEKPDVLN